MKKINDNRQLNNTTLKAEEMITSYPVGRMICIIAVMAALFVVVVISAKNGGWIYVVGILAFMIYVPAITFAQKKSSYRFEFKENKGLQDFKVYYKDRELKLDYRLDKNGRFMWQDAKKEINNICYADGGRMDTYFTRYRILNYINSYMEQNGLRAEYTY